MKTIHKSIYDDHLAGFHSQLQSAFNNGWAIVPGTTVATSWKPDALSRVDGRYQAVVCKQVLEETPKL